MGMKVTKIVVYKRLIEPEGWFSIVISRFSSNISINNTDTSCLQSWY